MSPVKREREEGRGEETLRLEGRGRRERERGKGNRGKETARGCERSAHLPFPIVSSNVALK